MSLSNVIDLKGFRKTNPSNEETKLSEAPFIMFQSYSSKDYVTTAYNLTELLDEAISLDTTEPFFGCDEDYEYGAFELMSVIPNSQKVVRLSVHSYDMESGLEILNELRRAS